MSQDFQFGPSSPFPEPRLVPSEKTEGRDKATEESPKEGRQRKTKAAFSKAMRTETPETKKSTFHEAQDGSTRKVARTSQGKDIKGILKKRVTSTAEGVGAKPRREVQFAASNPVLHFARAEELSQLSKDVTFDEMKDKLLSKMQEDLKEAVGETDPSLHMKIEAAFEQAEIGAALQPSFLSKSISRSSFQESFLLLQSELKKFLPEEQVNQLMSRHGREIVKCMMAEIAWMAREPFSGMMKLWKAMQPISDEVLAQGPKDTVTAIKLFILKLEDFFVKTNLVEEDEKNKAYDILRAYAKKWGLEIARDQQKKIESLESFMLKAINAYPEAREQINKLFDHAKGMPSLQAHMFVYRGSCKNDDAYLTASFHDRFFALF